MNKTTKTIAGAVLLAFIILRFPWILGDMPEEVKATICKAAAEIITFGVAGALFFIRPTDKPKDP